MRARPGDRGPGRPHRRRTGPRVVRRPDALRHRPRPIPVARGRGVGDRAPLVRRTRDRRGRPHPALPSPWRRCCRCIATGCARTPAASPTSPGPRLRVAAGRRCARVRCFSRGKRDPPDARVPGGRGPVPVGRLPRGIGRRTRHSRPHDRSGGQLRPERVPALPRGGGHQGPGGCGRGRPALRHAATHPQLEAAPARATASASSPYAPQVRSTARPSSRWSSTATWWTEVPGVRRVDRAGSRSPRPAQASGHDALAVVGAGPPDAAGRRHPGVHGAARLVRPRQLQRRERSHWPGRPRGRDLLHDRDPEHDRVRRHRSRRRRTRV